MGTRNLTIVISNGDTKVAQYGQWDGYPSGVGSSLLEILKDNNLMDSFISKLGRVRFLEPDGRDKEFIEKYDKAAPEWSNEPDKRTPEQKQWWSLYQTRDLAEEVIRNIANSEEDCILLADKSDFAADSLFCEWAYVVDLDKKTFEVYEGFNQRPLTEGDRFFYLQKEMEDGEKYYPVRLIKEYPLSSLPDEDQFIKDCDPVGEEEEN